MEYTTVVTKIDEYNIKVLGINYFSEEYLETMLEREYERGKREGQKIHVAEIVSCTNCANDNSFKLKFPKDATGITVKVGDKVKGEGFITFHDGFKIDRTPIVTVGIRDSILYFGSLSASSFNKFWIVK